MKEEQRAALHKRKLKMKEEVEMHLHGIQEHLKLAFEKSKAAAMGGRRQFRRGGRRGDRDSFR